MESPKGCCQESTRVRGVPRAFVVSNVHQCGLRRLTQKLSGVSATAEEGFRKLLKKIRKTVHGDAYTEGRGSTDPRNWEAIDDFCTMHKDVCAAVAVEQFNTVGDGPKP